MNSFKFYPVGQGLFYSGSLFGDNYNLCIHDNKTVYLVNQIDDFEYCIKQFGVKYMSQILDRYYSMPEICKYLGISRDTALRWIATKNMPAHKIGKNCKFKISEIDEWVNNGQAEE